MSTRAALKADSPELSVFPASFAQQRMWFLERFEGGAVYNVPVTTRLRGTLDVAALERAFEALIERHETLRTVFTLVDGEPHQVIRPPRPFSLDVVDVSEEPDAGERAVRIAEKLARTPFDLAEDEPIRIALIRVAETDHVLSITLHHIVTDAWSMGVLTRELTALYAGFCTGDPVDLTEPEIQYADFAVWQKEWIESGGLDLQLEYWRDQLAGAPALLELPTDHPRPTRQSFRGATARVMLPHQLLDDVKAFGERHGATLFMTLLAAYGALLSRYSGQDDVVIASPVANRDRIELEGVIGLFVNTLPLRVDLADDPSFTELVARVRETALGAFSNQDLPFEKLVEKLAPQRHLSHPAIAQVMFVLHNTGERPASFRGLEAERIATDRESAKFDLTFFAGETKDGLRLSLEYCSDLFDESTALRLLDQYRLLLEAAVADPSRPIGDLELVTPEEGARLLAQFAGEKKAFPAGCLHELFEQRVAAAPDSVAITFEGTSLSYDELNVRANKLARSLREAGVGRETLVALCLERSLDLVVAILGVLKAGGAYVPLDPDYPADRLAFVLADTAAPVLLTQERLIERLPEHDAEVICLDRDAARIDAASGANLEGIATPESAAYVIYTSGSTGQPKGVTVEHRNVARLLTATEHWFDFGADDCWLLLHSYAFDFSVWELWGALAYGGRLVVVPYWTTRAPSLLRDLIVEERVTVLNATPSLFLATMAELLSAADALSLRVVVFGGEALQPPALRPWFDRFGEGEPRLVNMYGITETTVHVTYRVLAPADAARETSPIGEPIPDLQVYVLDSRLKPVPENVPGELFVGGAGVARGYLNRPELTAQRFLANPHGDGLLYRSGDRARHHNGELFYLGRIDSQVKIRGFRIELGEIEATLQRQAGVRDALVAAREDASGDKRLFAYVLGDTGAAPSVSELRDQLRRALPDYMVPSGFVVLDAFPLTPNGKVDRTRLLAMDVSDDVRERALVAPRTPLETQLVAIWSNVLGVETVGVQDDFFELGGHSLLAVKLFAEMERKLGLRLPLSALFEAATIEGLAELIERERREEVEHTSIVSLRKGDRDVPLFLVGWAGGEVLPYRDLVENLDPHLSVIGLRAPGADGRTTPLDTVEALAAHYVSEVRRAQPHGPYRLGGYCFSGLVAYEMARQLQASGETVANLALMDAYPYRKRRQPNTFEIGRTQMRALRKAGRAGWREWVRKRKAGMRHRWTRAIYIKAGPRLFELLSARGLQRFLPHRPWNLVLIASNLARHRYVPQPLDVKVVFYRAQTEPHSQPTPWDELATDGVELRQIVAPGINHERMMHEPYVQLLATRLMSDLDGSGLAEAKKLSIASS